MKTQSTDTLDDDRVELPTEVADAWAAVLIDVYEKRRPQKADRKKTCGEGEIHVSNDIRPAL